MYVMDERYYYNMSHLVIRIDYIFVGIEILYEILIKLYSKFEKLIFAILLIIYTSLRTVIFYFFLLMIYYYPRRYLKINNLYLN